jgi:UDP-N-acetylglucosamine diphosphorylase / glucose-1-phosphate thymidylyltransferase / UDP-N-acetylgalactosamine diphosphorylase / glucosamine-1-phosphate N-acetyltransferase / galactosamine-1-phosphate N-acetyltransferase
MKLILFEDAQAGDFYPLSELRPVWELRTGLGTLRERIEWRLGQPAAGGFCRAELAEMAALAGLGRPELEEGEAVLLVNARLLHFDPEALLALEEGEGMLQGETLVAARLRAEELEDLDSEDGPELEIVEAPEDLVLAERLWQLIHALPAAAEGDWLFLAARLGGQGTPPEGVDRSVRLLGAERILVRAGAEVGPGCVLDARGGPIVIHEGARLGPYCVVEGPALIGADSRLKPFTRLLGGCHLGPQCRVAGEIAESILQGWANKQHEGFLGHAYLGEWTNLGAGTENSDLKNNYGSVSVSLRGEAVDTGERFVGLMLGDHSKCGINTMFNTGTVVGIFVNLWGGGFPPKEIPAFRWGGPQDGWVPHALEKALDTARTVMQRRGRSLSAAEETLIRTLHARCEDAR